MNQLNSVTGVAAAATMLFALAACSTQEEVAPKPAPASVPAPAAKAEAKAPAEKAAEKAKATKLAGDVGLLDTEKNYLILVTKEGKLITLDFDQKSKVTMLEEKDVKMGDVGLGSSANLEYVTKGEKKMVTKMEFRPAKGE